MSRKEGMPPALPSDSQNFSSISNSLSSSITNLANSNLMQCGRRPFIIQDASQRMMLHKIRDSLAHLQKNSLPSPGGSDTSGASGTSTPNKEVAGKEVTKRNDYNRDALAEIKKDLQKFKNDDNKDQEEESTLKVNVKEIIQQIYPNESINNKTAGPLHIQKIQDSVKVEQQNSHTEHETVSPPPLPPRTRGQSPPPPPLPTRDYFGNLTPTGLSRSSAQYQPVKRTKEAVVNNSNGRGVSPGPATSASRPNSGIPSISSLAPNATPPSTLEQLAQQTGYTTEEIQKILLDHSAKQRQHQLYFSNPSNPFPISSHNEQNIFAQTINDGRPVALTQQQAYSGVVNAPLASPTNGNSILPPNYTSAHNAAQSAPPPPYKTPHQTSPASSVTSGSSNDYLLYGHSFQPVSSEYKASAYGESLSSGSSSPASLHSHPSYNHFHSSNAGGAHMNIKPLPVPVWEAKPHPVITQSARSQMVARPVLQTATAPPSHTQAPPSYTSVRHHVTSAAGAGIGGGNVHIKLRNHQDPQLQVTGFPNFQVTAQTSPHAALKARGSEFNTPSIQIQFSSGNPTIDAHGRRKGSLETRSDSPVSRATNQSPCSLISSTSTGSDLIPERPPPPYPGPSKLYSNGPIQTAQTTSHPPSAEISEVEQSETESENDHPATKHKCTSPIPKLRPEGDKKDEDRGWTKLRHYSPAAFKFYMEQHIENILKQHKERIKRKVQLESEMSKVDLSEEAKNQMRLMLNKKETIYLRLKRAKMDRSMFEVIAKLGIGAFGEVSLVRKCRSEADEQLGVQLYAMKTLRKVDVIRRNQVAHVKAERDILAEADLEWVVKLYYSFQDKENLYFIMEYIPGGDLMALLIKKGIFEEPLAVFYIAELVCAIDSVHKMGFIHRDIKPDNILIDRDGHIKLTDFGLCTGFRWTHNSKYYQEGSHLRQDSMDVQDVDSDPCNCQSKELNKILERRRRKEKQRCLAHSLVGTPNYIAPEVLLREGYTKTCDWWSVGVILYEMLVGHPPFYANSPKETQLKVVNWKQYLRFPEDSKLSVPAHDLILKLCCDAFTRLGKNGAEEIKRHSLFRKIDFNELRRQKPPHKPVIRYPTDTSNFDEVEDQEPCPYQTDDLRLNGHYPEHAFSEFTFRRFFDDGHSRQLNIAESLSHGLQSLSLPPNGTHGLSSQSNNIGTSSRSEEQTTQNSYHKDETRSTGGNPVYV